MRNGIGVGRGEKMAIEFLCPECKSGLRVGDDSAGKVVRCGSCMATVRVPVAEPRPTPSASDDPFARSRPDRRAVEPVAPPPAAERPRPRPPRRRPPPPKQGRGVLFWVLIVLGILTVLGIATCAGVVVMLQPKWRTHTSPEGGFKAELPAPARPDMRDLAKLNNKPDVQIEGTVLLFAGEEYAIFYGDIDEATRTMSDEKILDKFVKDIKKDDPLLNVGKTTNLKVSGCEARELLLTHPEGSALCRIVIADRRFFMVWGGSRNRSAEQSPNIRRFINSFEVTDTKLLAKVDERRRKEKDAADAEARVELDELRAIGEDLGERAAEKAEALRDQALSALEDFRAEARSAGRIAGQTALATAERERAVARERPELPVAPPPRVKGTPIP